MKTAASILFYFLFFTCALGQKLLVPVSFNPKNEDGKIAILETDDLSIFVENLEVHNAAMVFDVEIRNISLHPLTVDPDIIHVMVGNDEFPVSDIDGNERTLQYEQSLTKYFALPEEEVTERYHRSIQSNKTAGTIFVALAAGLVAFDIVKDMQDFSSPVWTEKMARNSWMRDVASMAGVMTADIAKKKFQNDSMEKQEDMEFLTQEILTITRVKPMQAVRGKVFFPQENAKYIRMIIPLNEYDYVFDFRKAKRKDRKSLGISTGQSVATLF